MTKVRAYCVLSFAIAGSCFFVEAQDIVPMYGRIAFYLICLVCIYGIIYRWGPLIPSFLIAFIFGQILPWRHG